MDELVEKLKELGIPHDVHLNGEYTDITIEANASDKYVTMTFKNGEFAYSN